MDKLANSAQRQARSDIVAAIAADFPAHVANVAVVPFSATRRIGVVEAEAAISHWLGLEAHVAAESPFAEAKNGPRDQGE
jgi:GTP-binding protein EngB required for normal cell division